MILTNIGRAFSSELYPFLAFKEMGIGMQGVKNVEKAVGADIPFSDGRNLGLICR